MKARRRLYMGDATLANGLEVQLCDEHAHYLVNVLRLKVGDEVYPFTARDGEWRGEITQAKKNNVSIKMHECVRAPLPALPYQLTLAFAPLKKDRTDFLVEKASELGVHVLQPIFTDHTQSERVNNERLQITAIEAAEQCDRLDAPHVIEAQKLSTYLSALPKDAIVFLAAERGDATPIKTAFSEIKNPAGEIHFIIGPEGGFSEKEFEQFARVAPIRPVRLGARLLRAETAATAVLATFQAIAGDWQ